VQPAVLPAGLLAADLAAGALAGSPVPAAQPLTTMAVSAARSPPAISAFARTPPR
jgi:hypothetical protein